MTKKTLLPTNDLYVQFTDEEIQKLGWEAGQKLNVKVHDDGSIELRPFAKVEIDLADWSREVLEMVITESCEKDISVNEVVSNLLKQSLDMLPDLEKKKEELLLEKDYLYNAKIDLNFTNNDTSITNARSY
jgi:bifunctional DNA-binding transcriptional regulator/antitoxin component of YhaV-PrlF toxin-antitoxin module